MLSLYNLNRKVMQRVRLKYKESKSSYRDTIPYPTLTPFSYYAVHNIT